MAEYFALQAALFFASSHILIRRGLVSSNALTGSVISLGLSALTLWIMVPFSVPLSAFMTPASWYFLVAGLFAPGLGRTLTYIGIEKIGVARSVPVSNCSPIIASILAVAVLGEQWRPTNILGTCLVILGVVILSTGHSVKGSWRKVDMIYPVLSAIAFGISTNLRKLGLMISNVPLMAAALTAATAVVFAGGMVWMRGGLRELQVTRTSLGWFFAGGLVNTAAMLSVFYALSFGKVVIVEPLTSTNPVISIVLSAIFLRDLEAITVRIALGAALTVIGTLLVMEAARW